MGGWDGWTRWNVIIDEIIIGQFPKGGDDGLNVIDSRNVVLVC